MTARLGGHGDSIFQHTASGAPTPPPGICPTRIFTDKHNDLGTKILTRVLSILVKNRKIIVIILTTILIIKPR